MSDDIKAYVLQCETCQKTKPSYNLPAGKMMSAEVTEVFDTIGIDLMGPYPMSKNKNRYLLVVTDYFSKWTEIWPLKKATAQEIVYKLIYDIIARYGAPKRIISDQGTQFTSNLYKSVLKEFGIKQSLTTPYHPQSDMTERVNQNIKHMITAYIDHNHRTWDEYIPHFNFALRTAVHDSTRFSPAEVFLGRKLYTPWERELQCSFENTEVSQRLEEYKEVLDKVRANLEKARTTQKRNYDNRRREAEFAVGQKVLLRNHKRSCAADSKTKKFYPIWDGPFIIKKVISPLVYELTTIGHRTKGKFNVVDLKEFKEPSGHSSYATPVPVSRSTAKPRPKRKIVSSASPHSDPVGPRKFPRTAGPSPVPSKLGTIPERTVPKNSQKRKRPALSSLESTSSKYALRPRKK